MRWFNFSESSIKEQNSLKGLAVSVPELIEQQRYVPYFSMADNYMTSDMAGDVKSVFKGRGMEFEEVREYAFGDDIRDLDWRVTARKSEPYTKVYHEEKDREIVVLLDLSSSMIFGTKSELKSVTAAKLTALIGWMTLKNKDRFGLLLFDGQNTTYYKPQNNQKSLMMLFQIIADKTKIALQQNYAGNITTALKMFELSHKGRGTFFILSDFYQMNADAFKNIAALAKRHQIYCMHIFDVLEEIAPADGVYAAQNMGQKVVFNSASAQFKTAYQQYFATLRHQLRQNCHKFNCKYLEIRTDKPIFKQLGRI
ncbi:MAG: DUF58 domain-containing protein [Alphaproteobacteria bacterium]|jgi:uncharacterized protein (DUF58 family)|nr:DUF58 domain-containing protein [Alphaproteobacteria bacterium]